MVSNTQKRQTTSGTNSPPLEATGEEKPMGMASVDHTINAGYVPDREQRKEYFGWGEECKKRRGKKQSRKVGQSMSDKMEKMM
ncbi:hypothetical protein BDZ97DRAFT_1917394 [Flammula alnicola]|nr:hypothetical protein BDZ97DRAFT_1917394 [Flammula alnicola]